MVPVALLRLIAALAASLPGAAGAHAGHASSTAWNLEPWLLALLASSAWLYTRGARALWTRAGMGRGITQAQAWRFAGGWATLFVALVTPLDALGDESFAAHMLQHELLMVVAAPLLVTARPLEAWTWALPPAWRHALGNALHAEGWRRAWGFAAEPVGAWTLHAAALWLWHVPRLFEAALANEALHVTQHTCFLGSALLFWWSVLARRTRQAEGVAVASLFTTMMHTGVLGALLTFAPTVWYGHYAGAASLGLSALEDQQLGGLLMWVPAGLVYIATGLAIVASWLRETPREAPLR
jgi:putative membrane protein